MTWMPGDDDDLLVPRARTRDDIELEEEEYRTFLEREVGEDIRNLVTVEKNEAVGAASESVEIIENDDKNHKGEKRKKGKRERENDKVKNQAKGEAQSKKAEKQQAKKSKEEADHDFLMRYVLVVF